MPARHLAMLLLLAPTLAWGRESTVAEDPSWMVDRFARADGLPVDHVEDVALDAQGFVWAAGSDGLSQLDGASVRTWRRTDLPWLRGNRLTGVRATADGALLVTDPTGAIYRVDPASRPLQGELIGEPTGPVKEDLRPQTLSDGGVEWRVDQGALWRDATRLTPERGSVHRMLPDGSGGLWAATDGGLLHLRRAVGRTLDALPGRRSASVDTVRSDGVHLWVGAISGDLTEIVADRLVAVSATPTDLPHSGLASPQMRPLGDGTMGLFVRNVLHVLQPDGTLRQADPRVWPADSGPWLRTPDGADWLFTVAALYHRAPGAQDWAELRGTGGPVTQGHDVIPLGSGKFLVITADGLLWGPPDALAPVGAELSHHLRGARLDGDTLWIGTEDSGLCRLKPASDLAHASPGCLAEPGGLGEHIVHDIQIDASGRLWLGTDRGVLVLPRDAANRALDGEDSALSPIRLDERDGLRDAETNGGQGSVEQTPDGRLWYPTMGGPVVLDPARLPPTDPPPVRIERILVGGQEVSSAVVADLPADRRSLTVAWSAPELVRPEQVRYRYRLEGQDQGWHTGAGLREASWNDLPPGQHSLVVQASLGGGWGPERRLALARQPSFVESWAFPATLVLGSIAATALVATGLGRARRQRERALELAVAQRTAQLAERNAAVQEQATRLEQAGRRLAEVDAARTRFVANLSHELRTPLMLVMGSLEELERDGGERVALARRSADRLRELIDQLFDLVRLEAGRLPMRARRLDLGRWLTELVGRHAPLAAARGIRLELSATPGQVQLWVDPDLLEKAVGNLLSNGLKFTPRGGSLRVSLEADATEARVRVADDGPGVPAGQADRIFERFYQVSSGDDRQTEGAGIGLSLARELAELHGGSLRLLPQDRPGACFELTLPTGTQHLSAGDIALETSSGPVVTVPELPELAPGQTRVLIAEDHLELRAWLAARLADSYPVETVADGAEALRRLREGGFGLLLSDVMMPGMDGLSLCRAVRADPALAALPVVLLSARGEGASAEAYAAGATTYLSKPILGSELLGALQNLLPPLPPATAEDEAPPEPAPAELSRVEQDLLERIEEIARTELRNPAFSVEVLAQRVAMSPRTLHRRLLRLTGKAPVHWLQELRLERALGHLRDGRSVAEAAHAVGMAPNYFSRVFRAWYGHPPSQEARG